MRLRMLTTTKGSDDGHTVREYRQGGEYDVGGTARADELARTFIRERWAEDANAPALPPTGQESGPKSEAPPAGARKKGR
jgi:hypothetical protein